MKLETSFRVIWQGDNISYKLLIINQINTDNLEPILIFYVKLLEVEYK